MDAKTILSFWEKTLSEKVDYLSEHLADELVIDFLGNDSSSQTKDEHIAWCVSDESALSSETHHAICSSLVCEELSFPKKSITNSSARCSER